jgi:hypothetical protein
MMMMMTTTREMTMMTDRLSVNGIDHVGDHDHVNVNVNGRGSLGDSGCPGVGVGDGGGLGVLRVNVNAHSEAGCGTERDKLHGRVDQASAGRGDGTALHRDTAVNGRAMDRIPAERERVLAFSSRPRSAREQGR